MGTPRKMTLITGPYFKARFCSAVPQDYARIPSYHGKLGEQACKERARVEKYFEDLAAKHSRDERFKVEWSRTEDFRTLIIRRRK